MMVTRPLIKECLYLLTVSGCNPAKKYKFLNIQRLFCYLPFLTAYVNVLLDCFFNWVGLDSMEYITTASACNQIVGKVFVLIVNADIFRRVIKVIETFSHPGDYEKNSEIKNTFLLAKKSIICISATLALLAVLYLVLPAFFNPRKMPFNAYYPQNLNESPKYEIMYAIDVVAAIFAVPAFVGFDFLFIALVIYIICELKSLKQNLNSVILIIGSTTEERSEDLQELYRLIDRHNLILDCIKDIRRIYSGLLLNLYLCNMTCICAGLLCIVASGFPPTLISLSKYGVFSVFFSMQLFFYCAIGNYLTTESASVATAVFNSKWWVKTQPKVREACAMVIQRANKTEELTAGGLMTLNLESFTKIIKAALSFFTLMETFYTVS